MGFPLVKSILWNFGDGRTSTEIEPYHTYTMPGKYVWTMTITGWDGGVSKTSGTIYVYEYDYVNETLHVSYTDKCFRFAVNPTQGVGGAEWQGNYWLWPTAYTGTCKGISDVGDNISLVLNNSNGRFYRIGIKDLWTDRASTYHGQSIECSFRLKEHIAVAGEYQALEHIESHVHMRPYWETNRNLSGYGSDGFLDDHAVDLKMYEDGEPVTYSAKLNSVPRYGDYVYRKRVEAHRLQLEVLLDTSGWRCIKVQQQMMSIDKVASPSDDYPTEDQWQQEFKLPDFWVSRDSFRPILNRASGSNCSGNYDALTSGPDSNSKSAMGFIAGQGLYYAGLSSITGNFTLNIWVKSCTGFPTTLWRMATSLGGTLRIRIVQVGANYAVQFSDGVNYDVRQLTWTNTGWVMITVERSGTNLKIFENGVQLTNTPLTNSAIGYGGTLWMAESCICNIFDAIRVPRAVSSNALAYLYDDVVNNSGDGGMLPINR